MIRYFLSCVPLLCFIMLPCYAVTVEELEDVKSVMQEQSLVAHTHEKIISLLEKETNRKHKEYLMYISGNVYEMANVETARRAVDWVTKEIEDD